MLLPGRVVVGVIDCESCLVALRDIHGNVGIAHESLCVPAMHWETSDTDARPDIERLSLVQKRSLQGHNDAFGVVDNLRRRGPGQQYGKLVAAETRHAPG